VGEVCIKSEEKLKGRERKEKRKWREMGRKKNIGGGHRKHASNRGKLGKG